jgi:hypothetical protein
MVNLYVAGVLEQSGTFPHQIDPALVAAVPTIAGPHGGSSTASHGPWRTRPRARARRAIAASMSNAVVSVPAQATIEDRVKYLTMSTLTVRLLRLGPAGVGGS